jgi:SM-20-related protein
VTSFLPSDDEVRQLGEQGYFLRTHFLGEALCRQAALGARALVDAGTLRPAGLSRGGAYRHEARVRGDSTLWLIAEEAPEALLPLLGAFTQLGEALNAHAYLGLGRHDVQLALYPGEGARYVRHRDAFAGGQGENRRLTAILYLNEDWQPAHGGTLCLYPEGAPLEVAPRLDTLVVFLSERLEHEVLPAWAPRLAATAWYYGRSR